MDIADIKMDTRYELNPVSEFITDQGRKKIREILGDVYLPDEHNKEVIPDGWFANPGFRFLPPLPSDWDWSLIINDKKAEYTGKLAKRIGAHYYKTWGLSLSKAHVMCEGQLKQLLQYIGEEAVRNTTRHAPTVFAFTDNLDSWKSGEFHDSGSCFFSSGRSSAARFIMMRHNVCAIRFYKPEAEELTNNMGLGRAWILFDKPFAGGMLVFNAYAPDSFGSDKTLGVAKIISQWLGGDIVYKKIKLENNARTGGTVYVNGSGTGYLIGPARDVERWNHYDLNFTEESIGKCHISQRHIFADDNYKVINGRHYLMEFINEDHFCTCEHCNEYFEREQLTELGGHKYCKVCMSTLAAQCEVCNEFRLTEELLWVDGEGVYVCPHCHEDNAERCSISGLEYFKVNMMQLPIIGYVSQFGKTTGFDAAVLEFLQYYPESVSLSGDGKNQLVTLGLITDTNQLDGQDITYVVDKVAEHVKANMTAYHNIEDVRNITNSIFTNEHAQLGAACVVCQTIADLMEKTANDDR